jgi:hypothetical protein
VVHLGSFVDDVGAALAYDQAAHMHYGVRAKLNFPHLAFLLEEPSSKEPPKRPRRKKVRGPQGPTKGIKYGFTFLLVSDRVVRLPDPSWAAIGGRMWTRRGCGRGPTSAGRPHAT